MSQVVIEDPILNPPYEEPSRHFRFGGDGITDEVVSGRRSDGGAVDLIRARVRLWREAGHPHVTPVTRQLLDHWRGTHHRRERRLFFCQVEAVETVIYLTEVAPNERAGKGFLDHLARASGDANPELMRLALKLATGAGKRRQLTDRPRGIIFGCARGLCEKGAR